MLQNLCNTFRDFQDIKMSDLALEYTDEKINLLNTHSSNLSKRGIFIRVLSFIKKAVFNSSFYLPNPNTEKILVACNSLNEYEAALFLKEKKDINVIFIGSYPYKHNFASYVFGFLSLPLIIIKILNEENKRLNNSLPYTLDQLMISSGVYFSYRRIFNKNVKTLFISNHLSPETIVAMHLAKKNKIKIVYLQHSQLVSKYPPIETNFYLLSGTDSLRKLKKINKFVDESKICFVGTPKLDNLKFKQKISAQNISVCVNPGADFLKVKKLILLLKNHFKSCQISIRPHPGIRSKYLKSYRNLNLQNVSLVKPNAETLFKFLLRNDIVISDDSGIYYEAGYAGNISLSYSMSNSSKDWYDLEGANHKISKSPSELINRIKTIVKANVNKRNDFKIFFANINTKNDGKAKELALNFLMKENLI